MHKTEERQSLAPYLERAQPLGWELMARPVRPSPDPEMLHIVDPQLRDLALSVIVELSGKRPADYGFVEHSTARNRHVYLFETMEQRNRGFKMCLETYRELGLDEPPAYTPEAPPRFFYAAWTADRSCSAAGENHAERQDPPRHPRQRRPSDRRGHRATDRQGT